MALPKDALKPAYNYTYPSERQYFSEATSTLAVGVVSDTKKSGKDYGIVDPKMTEPVTGTLSETGNGAKGV